MEFRQLKYFLAVYEEGSLTSAARRLNVVQPALSQQISKLEEEIGRPLFSRTPKGMLPTREGEEAYSRFSGIIRDLETASQALSGDQQQIRGTVSIGVVASVANKALGETLQKFVVKYPEVHVKATGGYTTDLQEMLRTSRLDLIVVNAPPHLRDPRMVDIVTEDLCLISSSDTGMEFDGPVSLERINELKLVIPSQRHGLRLIMDRAAAEQNIALAPRMEFDELKLIEDFVRATDYFTILPPIAVFRALRQGHLKAYPITPDIPRRLVYVTNPARPLSAAAEALIAEIREDMIEYSFDVERQLRDENDLPAVSSAADTRAKV